MLLFAFSGFGNFNFFSFLKLSDDFFNDRDRQDHDQTARNAKDNFFDYRRNTGEEMVQKINIMFKNSTGDQNQRDGSDNA